MGILRKLWDGWKAFAHVLGRIQTAILLSIVYFLTIGPIGLIGRLFRNDFLGLRRSDRPSYWIPLPGTTSTIEQARKQF